MIDIEVIVERCAFLDVHRDTVMACARTPDGQGGCREEVTEFGSTTSQLLPCRLAGRTAGPLGGDGSDWRLLEPGYWVLEASIPEVWVISARHMRNVPGRKTDVVDAVWGASLLEHGLVRPSFIPPAPFRVLRDLTRYRKAGSKNSPESRSGDHLPTRLGQYGRGHRRQVHAGVFEDLVEPLGDSADGHGRTVCPCAP